MGKSDQLYQAHGYHTKVPHLAIVPAILHYALPGAVVLDAFSGSGMTGVAANFCGGKVDAEKESIAIRLNTATGPQVSWGARRVILSDLSPIAAFISYNYNTGFDAGQFTACADAILKLLYQDLGWMFETNHKGQTKGVIEFTIWSEIFSCPSCAQATPFTEFRTEESKDEEAPQTFCPKCGTQLSKRTMDRLTAARHDPFLKRTVNTTKRVPTRIFYKVGGTTYDKKPDQHDLDILERIEKLPPPVDLPHDRMMHTPDGQASWGDKWRAGTASFTHVHHLFLPRTAHVLAALWRLARNAKDRRVRNILLFLVEQAVWTSSILNRYQPQGFKQVNKYLPGVYYVPSVSCEVSPWYAIEARSKRLARSFSDYGVSQGNAVISTSSATTVGLPQSCIDYIFTDPPFGDNLAYSELNFVLEAFHRVFTNQAPEAIISEAQRKPLLTYHMLMHACFREYYRVLKPGRWMTVVFSNTSAAVWNGIQSALQAVGFVVANISALDKRLGSFNAVTTSTAVKQDLVISAYKPHTDLEERFAKRGETEEGSWDFIRTHLKNLPIVKAKGGQMELIVERDPRILYDRMVAFYVGHSTPVPLSSAEFQAGLAEKFPERDGMYFLPEQVNEYDKKRAQVENIGQMSIFVEDERSAIDWLRNFLKSRPSTSQEIHPEFMQQLGASWKKWEARPELSALLDQNFLCFNGVGEVPSQIHSYLSTQYKDLRSLAKDHPQLLAKAKSRWYVPDPKKNVDVETLRNKRLLEEFWTYLPEGYRPASLSPSKGQALPGLTTPRPKIPKGKKLKELRSEAIRAGFKHCYQLKDYQTILLVAELIPESMLQEDEQLQMTYDNAVTRIGGA